MSDVAGTVLSMASDRRTLDWLLDSDPALRWQVERDLAHAPPEVWERTRGRVATEGFGAELLSHQDPDGSWAGGAHFPKGFFDNPEPDQPWVSTSWSLKDLREWGVPAEAMGDTSERIDRNLRWEFDDMPFWGGEVDVCINGYTIASGAWLGADVSRLVAWFPEHQLEDGGWNCAAEEDDENGERSTRSSFHSTLNALRGLLAYEKTTGDTRVREARHGGEEYLLERKLMYRASTGEQVRPWVTEFLYPNRHRYSALAAVDYFREASLHDDTSPDPRLADAVEAVRAQRQSDGTWLQGRPLPGRVWFQVDAEEGEPSKWLTLFATRVLDWWDAAR